MTQKNPAKKKSTDLRARGSGKAFPRKTGVPGTPYIVTDEARNLVRSLSGMGVSLEGTASHLGINATTLKRHFAKEITQGKDSAVADAMARVVAAADKGNFAAIRLMYAIAQGDESVKRAERRFRSEVLKKEAAAKERAARERREKDLQRAKDLITEAKPEKVGKKEQVKRTAATAAIGTPWEGILKTPTRGRVN